MKGVLCCFSTAKRALVLTAVVGGWASQNASAEPASASELLKPNAAKSAGTQPANHLHYKLSGGSDKWDADPKKRITKAMDEAVALYNKYGDFDRELVANWNPGTPTADANFGGWINFGGQIGTRTALHEIAHCLGVGTSPKWGEFARGGKWTGKYAIAQLKEFDGPDAVLHCDRQHFWPYGLNYDTEVTKDSFKRNVMMVTAMRADMGLGPPPHPAMAKFKIARADAEAARAGLDKAQADYKVLSNKIQSSLANRPEVISAQANARTAKTAYDSAMAKALEKLHSSEEYQSLEKSADEAQKKLATLRLKAAGSTPAGSSDEATAAAKSALDAKTQLAQLQSKVLASDQAVVETRSKYIAASAALDSARESILKSDPELVTARQILADAKARVASSEQAATAAEQLAMKEAALDGPVKK